MKSINIWLQFQNVYVDKLDDIVNKCNNKYRKTMKMKLLDKVQSCEKIRIKKYKLLGPFLKKDCKKTSQTEELS